jgi:transposase InsO family protein
MLAVIEEAKAAGVSERRSCALLNVNRRRLGRWRRRRRAGLPLVNAKPGPVLALHALLPEERSQVLAVAKRGDTGDLSHRILTVSAGEKGWFLASFSTVYRIMRQEGLISMRGPQHLHNGRCLAPVRRELSGPNQRWCWDISYLYTYQKGLFLFLYLLLDEFSRKVIHWLISWYQREIEARQLIEGGLLAEQLLDLPEASRPEIINDRGRQMKAKSLRRMLAEHQMPQLFARPRTPNDNPYVEAAFSTVKRAPDYPGRFLDQEKALRYFAPYFEWYNTEHYHSGIGYVTPHQAHLGQREKILADRQRRLQQQRQRRKEVNLAYKQLGIYDDTQGENIHQQKPIFCSVIPR